MPIPELKQYGDLRAADLDRHPLWVACHVADHAEPWYGETDEETFRPADDALPVDAAPGAYLVKAMFETADGGTHTGFITSGHGGDLGMVQPVIILGDDQLTFWGSMFGVAADQRARIYAAFGTAADALFPIRFSVPPGLIADPIAGQIDGFYRIDDDDTVVVER